MSEVVAFKSGKDIGEEPSLAGEERLTCRACGAITTPQAAYETAWQFAPPICPCCRSQTLERCESCCVQVSS